MSQHAERLCEQRVFDALKALSREVSAHNYDLWAVPFLLSLAGACAARTMRRSAFWRLAESAYGAAIDVASAHRRVEANQPPQ